MVKKKTTRKRTSAGKKTGTLRRTDARKKVPRSSQRSRQKQMIRTPRGFPLVTSLDDAATSRQKGLGAHAAGQSGDTQGLSNVEEADSESVEELVEEGQDFEAGAVAGVEDADASQGDVHTKQVLEDDVPLEYLEKDLDQLNPKSPSPRNTAAKPTTASATRVSRGPVDAPGKRHRKPLPPKPIDKRLGEPRGKQMGQKSFKTGRRNGRG
jgi:hypothetical protein